MITANWIVCACICFIPLIALYVCFCLLVKNFSWWKGLICVLIGVVAVAPIAGFQWLFSNNDWIKANSTGAVLVSALILNGLIEELIKTVLLFASPLPVKSPFGSIVCGALSGMSLACVEIFVYMVTGWEQQLLRLASVWGIHVSCAVLCSLFVYSIKSRKPYVTPLLLAILLHGIYSYFAGYYSFMKYFCAAVIVVAAVECRLRYVKMTTGDQEIIDDLKTAEKNEEESLKS